jgi:hypothetical protein
MAISNETLKRQYMELALRALLESGKIVLFTPSSGEVHVTGIKAVTNLAALIAENAVQSFRASPATLTKVEAPRPSIPMPEIKAASGLPIG